MKTALLLIAVGLLAFMAVVMAYVRLAPSDPARWHRPIHPAGSVFTPGFGEPTRVFKKEGGAWGYMVRLSEPPETVLERLDLIALGTPRTRRIAGSPEEGMVTWVTRSALWGFPDYTTAQALSARDGTQLFLEARQRFGSEDFGVNEARLRAWLAALGG
ncbi:DUF1499 domain-containing protein [Ostreiculturibacter nitratireducens]|uniref:DUF1499 domain-containing protein n=1 Tax=Ostreiculturibacter nitratireducens TaxID=3075226 RepID=UPI0031B5E6ED